MHIIRFKLIIIFYFTLNSVSIEAQETKYIQAEEFYILSRENPDAVIIDTRMWEKYKVSRIPNSILAEKSKDLYIITGHYNPDHPFFLYCADGSRSQIAADYLYRKGYTNVSVLINGLESWEEHKYPVDTVPVKKSDIRKIIRSFDKE